MPHGDAVGDGLKHGQVVGAVPDGIAVLRRRPQGLDYPVDAPGFGASQFDHLQQAVFPADDLEMPGDQAGEGIQIAARPGIDAEFVELKAGGVDVSGHVEAKLGIMLLFL